MDNLITIGGQYLIIVVALIAVITTLFSDKQTRQRTIVLAVLSFLIAFGIASIAGLLYYDTRPFVQDHTVPIIPHAADNGFPSNHTLYAMVAAVVILAYNKKVGILLGTLAALIGVSRVMAEIHHPIDILVSFVIAFAATGIALAVLRLLARVRIVSFLG